MFVQGNKIEHVRVENPYVAVVAKKYRNMKKKVEKVTKLENELNSGKELNSDQLQSISTRGELERSLADLESIMCQLLEVSNRDTTGELVGAQTKAWETVTSDVDASEVCSSQCEGQTVSASEATNALSSSSVCLHTGSVDGIDHSEIENIRKLLEVLHVCSNYNARVTDGSSLPPELDYFGKSLLGQTSVAGYSEALDKSCDSAVRYVTGSSSEIIKSVTYTDMHRMVSELAARIGGNSEPDAHTVISVTADATVEVRVAGVSVTVPPVEESEVEVQFDTIAKRTPEKAMIKQIVIGGIGGGSKRNKASHAHAHVSFSASTKLEDRNEVRFAATAIPETEPELAAAAASAAFDDVQDLFKSGDAAAIDDDKPNDDHGDHGGGSNVNGRGMAAGRYGKCSGVSNGSRSGQKKQDFNMTQVVTEPPVKREKPEKDKYGNVIERDGKIGNRTTPPTRVPASSSAEKKGSLSYAHATGSDSRTAGRSSHSPLKDKGKSAISKIPIPAKK